MFTTKQAIGGLGCALMMTGLSACAHSHHGMQQGHHERASIVVIGLGEARGAPDVARTSIGVEARAPNVQEAMQLANAQIAQITKALKDQGVADADLRTHGFSVAYDREAIQVALAAPSTPSAATELAARPASARAKKTGPAEGLALASEQPSLPVPAPARGGYVVSNQLEVTVRNVSKLGDVLSAATQAGANNVWGISFDLSDKRPLIEKARVQAFEHARLDAERLAALSGVKLGAVTHVVDGAGSGANPFGAMRNQAYGADSVPVQQGELTITHQVSLEYAIARD